MHVVKMLAAGAALLVLAGCQTQPREELNIVIGADGQMTIVDRNGRPSTRPEDQALQAVVNDELVRAAAEQAPEDIWAVDGDGHATHKLSGAICPATWAGLPRIELHAFAADGTDVGCNYQAGDRAVTFYIYHSPNTLDEEMKHVLEPMRARQPTARETPFGSLSPAYKSVTLAFAKADGVAMRTSALLATAGGWMLKLRVTNPAENAPQFETTAGLTFRGQAERLSASPPPARTRVNPDRT